MINKLKNYIEIDFDNTTTLSSMTNKKTPPKFWTVLPGADLGNETENEGDLIIKEINLYIEKAKQFRQAHVDKIKLDQKEKKVKDGIYAYADTLLFWKTHEQEFNFLSKKAKFILAIPATSASVERFFSKTGYIMRPHRRRLSDKMAHYLFFLKGNAHIQIKKKIN